jgi:hypothetical protein
MSTPSAKPSEPESPPPPHHIPGETGKAQGIIAWSSFFFAILQSICTFFAALEGLRLLIGVGSLAIAAWMGTALDRLHADWIRLPMIGLAFVGSLVNLVVLLQLRRLRNRPAAQWRQKPLSPRKIRMERVQMILSIATLVIICVEEYLHFRMFHQL